MLESSEIRYFLKRAELRSEKENGMRGLRVYVNPSNQGTLNWAQEETVPAGLAP